MLGYMAATDERQSELEARLLELSATYPRTPARTLDGAVPVLLMAARARSLFTGFLHCLAGPSEPTMAVALRPLVEATIRLRWYSIDPGHHRRMLRALSASAGLALINDIRKHLGPLSDAQLERLEHNASVLSGELRDGRQAVDAAGRTYRKRGGPSLEQMVDEVVDAIPGHKLPMRQAYVVAFRALSPWVHTEASSFDGTTVSVSPAVADFVGDRVHLGIPDLRRIGGSMMAYSIETVSTFTIDAESMIEARAIRDEMVGAPTK
jgi:hypothetical protein